MIRSNTPISITSSTIIINRNLHDNRPLVLNVSAGTAVTLPDGTAGNGQAFRFVVGTASNANVVSCHSGDSFVGGYMQGDNGDSAAVTSDYLEAAAGNNTYSPTTAGGGGLVGDHFEVVNYAPNKWLFSGFNQAVNDPTNRLSTV